MFKKVKDIIIGIAKNCGFMIPANTCSLTDKLVKSTQRRLPNSKGGLEVALKDSGKAVVTFSDPMTGRNYEVRRMLETGGDLHLIDSNSRMGTPLDAKSIKALAKRRGSKSVLIKDGKVTKSFVAKKSFEKKKNELSIVSQKSQTESLGGGKKHAIYSNSGVNVSLDEVSVYKSDSEVFQKKYRKNTNTSTFNISSYAHCSKTGVTLEARQEERLERTSKSAYSMESRTVTQAECWDATGYSRSVIHERVIENDKPKKRSIEVLTQRNEHTESITSNGVITISEADYSRMYHEDKYSVNQTMEWTVARSILDRNEFVVEVENGGVYTLVNKKESIVDSYSMKQSASNTGLVELNWNFGHYYTNKSTSENSLFSGTCWYDVDSFGFEMSYQTFFEDKKRGAMSSIISFEGDDFDEFIDAYKSLGVSTTNVPCLTSTFQREFSKN